MILELKAGTTEFEPVLICHGAEHDLRIAAVADSLWVNQGVSCNKVPGETFPITTDPQLGAYQKFVATGSEWKLYCPPDGNDIDFSLQLQSEFTAVPYKVALKLGDYRRVILRKHDPNSAPVVGDNVVAEVQIGSFYTDKELEGVEVEWYYDGELVQSVPTTSQGWSIFDYKLTAEGEHTITAKVHSPYDDTTVEQNFTIYVYMESPWEQATLIINGMTVEWNSPSAHLFRGKPNDVRVEAPFLRGKEVCLGLVNQDGLLIEAIPAFEAWVPSPDGNANWVVTAGGTKSGRIALKLLARDVAAWEVPSSVLSLNLADEVDVKIDGVAVPVGGNLFVWGKAQAVTLTPKSDSPLMGLPVTLTCAIKSGLDTDNVVSAPAFDSEQTTYSWDVTGRANSGTFQLALTGRGMTTAITLAISKLISNNLHDEVTVLLDGEALPELGEDFVGGEPRMLTLGYKNGDILSGLPLALDWIPDEGLEYGDLVSEPPLKSLTATHEWKVTGGEKDGTFKLKLFERRSAATLITPTNKLTANVKVVFVKFLGEEWVEIPSSEIFVPPGVWAVAVRVTEKQSPYEDGLVTFFSPHYSEQTARTKSNGVASSGYLLVSGVTEFTASIIVNGREYTNKLTVRTVPADELE